MYNNYRAQIRSRCQVGLQKKFTIDDQNALMLEKFLNALKNYSYNITNSNGEIGLSDSFGSKTAKWQSINDILSTAVIKQLIQQFEAVNPNLFRDGGFTAFSDNKSEQGTIFELKLAEISATLDAINAGVTSSTWNKEIELSNGQKTTQGQVYIKSHHTGQARDNTVDLINIPDKIARDIFTKYYHQSARNQAISKAKKVNAEDKLKDLTSNIQLSGVRNVQIKTDATGGFLLEQYRMNGTIPQALFDAFSEATFSAKSYKNGSYINIGGTSAFKVFLAVAEGSYNEKFYRYCRMLNCLHHHRGFHDESKAYIYRIRALYELTGANQRLGSNANIINPIVQNLIENPTGAKYLVINNPTASQGGIKVIATSRIADAIENYIFFNKHYNTLGDFLEDNPFIKSDKVPSKLSVEQALDSEITLKIDYKNLYQKIISDSES